MGMTLEQLRSEIKDQVVPLLKDTTSSMVAEAVREATEKYLKPIEAQHSKAVDMSSLIDLLANREKAKDAFAKGKGNDLGLMLRAVAHIKASHLGPKEAAEFAQKANGHPDVVKALSTLDPTAGGFLVPTQFSQDVVELLRPASAVRNLGPNILTMPTGTMRIPKITAGSAASYIGENRDIPSSQPTFGQIVLTFKKLAALVPVSNDLIRYSSPGADGIVRDDVVRAMAQRESQAFLRDDGTSSTPMGLRYWAGSTVAASTNDLTGITTVLGNMVLALMNNNIPFTRPGWIMSPRSWNRLYTIQNANGFFVYRPELMENRLWGYPFAITTQVPITLGGGTDSELYLADFADVAIGEAQNLLVDSSAEASYLNEAGTLVSAYSLDQSVVRCIAEHDFAVRRRESVAVCTNLNWI